MMKHVPRCGRLENTMKKIISLILALLMTASAILMTACGGVENATEAPTDTSDDASSEAPEVADVPETPYPVDRLTINGIPITEYAIEANVDAGGVIPLAVSELVEYIKLTCGAELTVVATGVAPEGVPTIHIDETLVTDDNDFRYFTTENGLVLAGSAKRSALYAVYNFLEEELGWRFFASDCETCREASSIDVANVDVTFEHAFDIRDIYWTEYFDTDISLKRYQNGDGKRHAMYNDNPESVNYGGSENFHPYGIHTFSALSGVSESEQPCLSDEATYQRMLATAKAWLLEDRSRKMIHVSQNDNQRYCTCEECAADHEYYGSPAGNLIEFVNRMDNDLKAAGIDDVTIITFAYQYTFPCPKNIKCNDDVAIELCTITSCYNHAFDDATCPTNSAAMAEIDAWSKICDEFYIWDYTIDFKYLLSPFANFDVLLPNIRYLSTIGAVGLLEQGNYQTVSGEFGALRSYLIAKCMQNPNMTETEYYAHMDEFLKAYYGEGWTYVRNFIDFFQNMANEKNSCFGVFSSPEEMYGDHAFEIYNELLIEWWDKAEELAGTEEQLLHVRRSRLCCDYLRIGAIHHQVYDNLNKLKEDTQTLHDECFELGVTRVSEGFAIPEKINATKSPWYW